MVLTKGDDFPIHQTPEPVLQTVGERNFYDRYFFNGYGPDGSDFFALAFGVYPQLGVVDAHFSCIRGGTQYCLHASREMGDERMDLSAGPVRIEIIEPLEVVRVVVEEHEGLSAEITFTARSAPIEEPRFTYRNGARVFMDYTRMTQNCTVSGWISVDGERRDLADGSRGTRDRSWGIRPVGASDTQPIAPPKMPQFFWQWTPVNFPERSVFFHLNADQSGAAWNTRAVIVPDGSAQGEAREVAGPVMDSSLAAGTRWPDGGVLTIPGQSGDAAEEFTFRPVGRFQMRGLGYTSPEWGHGTYHGELEVAREDIALDDLDPLEIPNFHVQILCEVTGPDGETGFGIFEQLVIGAYDPLGLKGLTDSGAA
ncbi:hypothetical protein N8940_01350 [Sphingomonadaceae bacterium]|nr:hypothetical protein [Sphingomonadaceae bacterium]